MLLIWGAAICLFTRDYNIWETTGGKESVYTLYLVTTVYYFMTIWGTPFLRWWFPEYKQRYFLGAGKRSAKHARDWNIVLSRMRCFEGLVSSRRNWQNSWLEIYNLGVVLELQICKKVDFLMIYMYFFFPFFFFDFFCISEHCLVMNEVFWRFGELSSKPSEFFFRDLKI